MRTTLIALVAAATAGLAYAQGPSQPEVGGPDIVVTAPDREEVREFVDGVAVTGRGDQLARWDDDFCPSMVGLRAELAQALIDRVALRAQELELDVGEPGCTANVVIIATRNSDEMAREFADNPQTHLMRNDDSLGRSALESFANTPRPVRWWYFSGVYPRRCLCATRHLAH